MALLDLIRPVLAEQGELATVELLLFQVMARGTGAAWQRETFARVGGLAGMIAQAIDTTALPTTPMTDQGSPLPAKAAPLTNQATPVQHQGSPLLDNQTL